MEEGTPKKATEAEVLGGIQVLSPEDGKPHDFGVEADGVFYLWNKRLDPASRKLRSLNAKVDKVINTTVLVVMGVIFLFFIVNTFVLLPSGTWSDSDFWTQPSLEQLPLWLGLSLSLYFIYRRARSKRGAKETGDQLHHDVISRPVTWEAAHAMPRAKRVLIADHLAKDTLAGLDAASELASTFGHSSIGLLHLFAGQLSQPRVGHLFARLGLTFEDIKDHLGKKLSEIPRSEKGVAASIDSEGQKVITGATVHALMHGRTVVTPVDVFVSAYRNSEFLREAFYAADVEEDEMENVLVWLQIRENLRARWESFRKAGALKPKGNMNRAMTAVATPFLDGVSQDITALAARGGLPMLIGRKEETERVLRVFEGGGRSVVLVGEPGVGKQAIVHGIAEMMVNEKVPELLKDRRLVQLDIGRLVAGATAAQAEQRLLMALNEVAKSRNIAIAIPNIDDMVGISSGGGESLDVSAVLAAELEKGYFVAITTSTPSAYRKSIEGTALGSVLAKVDIDEPDKNAAIQVVESRVGIPESQHKVIFSYDAVEACVELTARYIHDSALPEKALRVLDEVALAVKQERGAGSTVKGEDVAKVVSSMSKIPLTAVTQDESKKLLTLETEMHKRVIGQDEAVSMVSAALRRARTSMRSGGRPIANFLFMGPTGVGKTELAKTIAESYFGDENAMIRLDMSEYQEPSSINRLLGSPGSGQGGVFTEAVRKSPFALILLDELEKAHPDILNVFLQVFDDGRLTDAVGRTVDFTQTIIVATSNVGALYIQDEIRKNTPMDQIKTHLIEEELSGTYRPEFLNRFDGIIVFTPLTPDDVMQIAQLMLGGVIGRMEEKGIKFNVTDAALKELSVAGYDPQFGARPLRRVIQEKVEDPMATILLEGKAGRRDTITLDAGGEMSVEKAQAL